MIESKNRRTNVTGRLFGDYQAQVVNVEHPDKLYLVTVRLLSLWDAIPDEDLPYAEFLLPIGSRPKAGAVIPVEKDDFVWVDFPRNGDTRYPRIKGSLYYAPDNVSYLPDEVHGEKYEPKRSDGEPVPAEYTRKDYLFDRYGLRELRTATGSWSITHKETGSAIEITTDGKIVIHCESESFDSSIGLKTSNYAGGFKLDVTGNCDVTVSDAATIKAKSCDVTVSDAANVKAGSAKVQADSIDLDSSGELNLKAGGNVNFDAGGIFNVKASLANFKLG